MITNLSAPPDATLPGLARPDKTRCHSAGPGVTLRGVTRPELTELDHLREVERLARAVVAAAGGEGWLSYAPDPDDTTGLQRAVNALARSIRHYHFPGDGCAEEDERPVLKLAGVAVLRPDAMPTGWTETYEDGCGRLGVEPRPEGWALWNTWGDHDMRRPGGRNNGSPTAPRQLIRDAG
ncbi:hypothetical protein [Streptomyces nigra]|uniref:hypothetical protein n=1 Tax=Streptomyces nigra TaxID=1827580 RepID=UPI0036D05CAA